MTRVLIDNHHADLTESLHLLFADRFGWEVYLPVGMEWWDEWYWSFGRSTWNDDRLARQFLTRANVEVESAHPQRRHRVIELHDALDMHWDYVVASVPDNYPGYRKFATETGARFVIQVGNVNQYIDWSRDPIVLNSSEAALEGPGVQYHQEFSLRTFRYSDPTTTRRITSMVNCPQALPCYPIMFDLKETLADFDWKVHGIDGPDGNLKPESKIADAMRASGWAWHDKVTGDGFGHVIHNWAAVGRPLIGHASHYAGKLAGPFWQDGVTAIDLDKHPSWEAAQMIREISADPVRHRKMCLAIRGLFDALVDFDVEAEKIRAALT